MCSKNYIFGLWCIYRKCIGFKPITQHSRVFIHILKDSWGFTGTTNCCLGGKDNGFRVHDG